MAAVPKPTGKKKKKKLYNGYKDKGDRVCFYCGSPFAERHEVYRGSNRQNSIRYGFQVDLCPSCHDGITNLRSDEDIARDQYWKKRCQREFEAEMIREHGLSKEGARELFMEIIGRNYLEELL